MSEEQAKSAAGDPSVSQARRRARAESPWGSPLVVAIFAAAAAGLANIAVTLLTGQQQQDLEARKAESDLILEVVKTEDPDKAAVNLGFLVDTKLVKDKERVTAILDYLKTRHPGSGVSLPAPNKSFTFENSAAVTPEATAAISNALTPLIARLIQIGFPADIPQVQIRVDPTMANDLPSYYLPAKKLIVLSPKGEQDNLFPLAEYTMHALDITKPSQNLLGQVRLQVEYGVRDYLVASYLNDPDLGTRYKNIFGQDVPALHLENSGNYRGVSPATEPHEAASVWANAFWSMREALGADKADRLVVKAWLALPNDLPDARYPETFLAALNTAARDLPPADLQAIRLVLGQHGFPPPT